MRPRPTTGLSVVEILVGVAILGVLVVILTSTLLRPSGCGYLQPLSNLKQLHLATQQMALDGETTKTPALGWPGDTGGTFTNWAVQLVRGNYLTTNDFRRLLSAPDMAPDFSEFLRVKNSAVLVYAVREASPATALILSSANFTNTPTGGSPPLRHSKPYGNRGFFVFRKAGDGALLQPRQTGMDYTNIIGIYVPLCQ